MVDCNHKDSDVVIKIENLDKSFRLFSNPSVLLMDSIKEYFHKRIGFPKTIDRPDVTVLDQISFDVKRGETVGIIGRNGSGKSTLLQIICKTLTPSNGSVTVNGRVAALLELGSGFNPEFTGRENVFMNATILGLTQLEIEEKYDSIVQFADIGEYINRPIKTYSSGMLVRLAFAVIAHVDADILVVDEALSVGDAFFVQKCMRFLREFMKNNTVLFVSHDTGAVVSLCNRAIWLENGRIMGIGNPKEISECYLEKQYESLQGNVATQIVDIKKLDDDRPAKRQLPRDMRADFINSSNLRNDIELFSFDESSSNFGMQGARVESAYLTGIEKRPLSWVVGGEEVILTIEGLAKIDFQSLIVGFIVKDYLGQTLFGDNTYITFKDKPISIRSDAHFITRFSFVMPILPSGTYAFSFAISEGSQIKHVQHYWVHDALMIKSHSSSISTGLVGVPMLNIEVEYND